MCNLQQTPTVYPNTTKSSGSVSAFEPTAASTQSSVIMPIDPPAKYVRNNQYRTDSSSKLTEKNWLQDLDEQFIELSNLPVGWDGYNGIPVTAPCTKFAKIILEETFQPSLDAPELVPGSDGTLQMEWHQNQFDIEIDVLDENHANATRYDHRSKELEETEVNTDYSLLVNWLAELVE